MIPSCMGAPVDMTSAAGALTRSNPQPARPALTEWQALRRLVAGFEPIGLAQLTSAALMDRSELKYLFPQGSLLSVLSGLRDDYCVLEVAGQRLSHYRTLYYDTGDLTLYLCHHAGRPDRYKVRSREYVDSHAAFLEVKHRVGDRHTVKSRIPIQKTATQLTAQAADFLATACPYPAGELIPCLWNEYTRITLVSKQRAERVTLDLDLAFLHEAERVRLPGLVVAEIKCEGRLQESEFAHLMRVHQIRATGFSKYCLGVSMLYPGVKHNNFKAKQRQVARLMGGRIDELR